MAKVRKKKQYPKQKYYLRQQMGCLKPNGWKPCTICGAMLPIWIYGSSPSTCSLEETGKDCTQILRQYYDKKRQEARLAKLRELEKELEETTLLSPKKPKATIAKNRIETCFHQGRHCQKYDICLNGLGEWIPRCKYGEGWEDSLKIQIFANIYG